ncbi:MAG TPA: response regulator [Spirochaetia bacterium]|nr:response regulator [Spirochaetia bacterium]
MASFGRHFQVIFDYAPVGMVIMDSAGRPLYTNHAIEAMLGCSGEELRESNIFAFVHPDDAGGFREQFGSLANGKEKRIRSVGRYVQKNGSSAWWSLDITHVVSAEHSPFMFAFMEDVTEQKADAERLKRAKDHAERATRTKSAFLANMSHEIRTPIHTITGMTELLLETHLDNEQQEYAQQVRFSAEVLLGLINDILDISKIEAGKLGLENIDFDLFAMTEDAVDMVSLEAHKKGLEVVLYLDPTLPDIVVGDPVRVRQVIVNLFNNAVKFTATGEVLIRVEPVSAGDGSNAILFEVVDTGIGIPEEKLPHLFQAFSQVDSTTTRRFGGTGLGLSICRNLVKMMNGTIGVKSQAGRGSTFWFVLPFHGRHAEPGVCRDSLEPFRASSVLLIDDNSTFRKQTVLYLQRWFTRVEAVSNGPEALRLLHARVGERRPFDVAVVDLMLPGMDGWQFASEVNADKAINSTRLILMSPTGNAGGEAKMKLLGWFNAYVNKPLKIREFYDALSGALASEIDLTSPDEEQAGAGEPAGGSTRSVAGTPPALPVSGSRGSARILVAEDHFVNQQLFKTILERMGHHVELASNGREALDVALAQPVDLIFMDVQMPEMNGYEAAEAIRRAGLTVPIVAVTANAQKGERERCLSVGMNDYLTKPFRSKDVLPLLERWLVVVSAATSPARGSVAEPAAQGKKPDEEIFNFAGAVDAFMGKEDIVRRVVREFIVRVDDQLREISSLITAGDFRAASIEAHAIKGGSWNIEAKRLGDAAARLEASTRDSLASESSTHLAGVRTAFDEFRAYCDKLPVFVLTTPEKAEAQSPFAQHS